MSEYLVDTNLLVGTADNTSPRYTTSVLATNKLRQVGHSLRTSSQNLMEFWRVATRPIANNGLGLTPQAAQSELNRLESIFPRLEDTDDVYARWRDLVVTLGVSGVQVHDARLVAVMLSHHITHILTFNGKDFTRFVSHAGIVVVDPASV